MIRVPADSVSTGDTLRIVWDLPAGSRLLRGPVGTDSLSVKQDTSALASWIVQPLAASNFGGDTLVALSPAGDTMKEAVPAWQARSRIHGTDSAAAAVLPPQAVPVPFPWDVVGWCSLGAVVAGLLVWAWLSRKKPVPPAPPAPLRDPVEVCREKLDAAALRSEAGHPPRETAFECGELLRALHGELHGWTDSVESTSGEWLDWTRARRTESERLSVQAFLSEADALRYADASSDARTLLAEARILLDTIARHRMDSPA